MCKLDHPELVVSREDEKGDAEEEDERRGRDAEHAHKFVGAV